MTDPSALLRWRRRLGRIRDTLFRVADRVAVRADFLGERAGVVIIIPQGLGDLILFTPCYRRLREHYAGEPITLICMPASAGYARSYLRPERVIALNRQKFRRNLVYRLTFLRTLAAAGAATALQPGCNREHMVEDAMTRASGASQRIGVVGKWPLTKRDRARGDRWYTRVLADRAGPHDATHYAAFALAVTGFGPATLLPRLVAPPRLTAAPSCDYMVIAPEASSPLKTWPVASFLAVAPVAEAAGLAIVLAGEMQPGSMPSGPAVCDLRGRLGIQELAALLAHAKLVLCNDSGPAHLSAALAVPALAVTGGGMPGRYLPYPAEEKTQGAVGPIQLTATPRLPCEGCGWCCRFAPRAGEAAPCVANIGTESVRAAVQFLVASAAEILR